MPTEPTGLGIRQEVKQIMANVFFNVLNVFFYIFPRFLRF